MDQCLILSKCSQLIVKIVTIKERLHTVLPEIGQVLFEFWVLEVFPLFIDIFLVEVVLHRRDERSPHPFVIEVLPWEV